MNSIPHEYLMVCGTMLALFATTLMRGIQNKAVAGGHKRMAFCFGTCMSACELLVMGLVASTQNPLFMMLGAVGSGAGWVAGMAVHDRLMRKRMEILRAAKKSKRARRIRNASRDEILKVLEERGLI